MFQEYDVVALTQSLSDLLKAGTRGAIVMIYHEPPEYEVEFVDEAGQTIEVRAVSEAQIRLVTENDEKL